MNTVSLRPTTEADEDFLRTVYAATREEELALVDWTEAQKSAFLRMQFDAQDKHYREAYGNAQFLVIERDRRPVGRLYISRRERDIRIMDIALLAEGRNAGVGTALLREILDEAARASKSVSIHVERFNRAMRLYERLGFTKVDEHGVYYLMEWKPVS